ncbi:FHA domain-containing protein [Arenibacterium halophilum]|nr:FHA domain-containing protein [Arenibacterium halophilum]
MALFKKVFDTHSDALARSTPAAEAQDTVADLRNIFAVEDDPHESFSEEDIERAGGGPADETTDSAQVGTSPEADSFDFAERRKEGAFVLTQGLRTVEDTATAPSVPAPETEPAPDAAELARRQIEAMRAQGFAPEVSQPSKDATPAPRPSAGRVRTRLLGFTGGEGHLPRDPVETSRDAAVSAAIGKPPRVEFPVGWIVVARGPGRGAHFALASGVSLIGRGDDNSVCLDFGDTAISRQNHAAIAYDDEAKAFYLGHGGKSNIIRLNGRPVLSTEEMHNGDEIRIGETVLKLVALCGADFTWTPEPGDG